MRETKAKDPPLLLGEGHKMISAEHLVWGDLLRMALVVSQKMEVFSTALQ